MIPKNQNELQQILMSIPKNLFNLKAGQCFAVGFAMLDVVPSLLEDKFGVGTCVNADS